MALLEIESGGGYRFSSALAIFLSRLCLSFEIFPLPVTQATHNSSFRCLQIMNPYINCYWTVIKIKL